jgi:hypothetical protein
MRASVSGADLASAIAGGDYLEFFITPKAGQRISLESFVFDQKSSNGTGTPYESNLSVFVSTNAFATPPAVGNEIGTSTVTVDGGIGSNPVLQLADVAFSLASIGYITDADTLHFRVYCFDDGSDANMINRIDNIRVAAMGAIESVTTTPLFDSGDQTNDVFVTSFSVGGYNYSTLTPAAGVGGTLNPGREFLWGASPDATDPGAGGATFAEAFESAVTDLNLTTGSLNGGSGAIYRFETSSGKAVGMQPDDLIYIFINEVNQLPLFSVTAVNISGSVITTALPFSSSKALKRFDLLRSLADPGNSADALNNRNVFGVAFKAADFIFTGGNASADIAGVKLSATTLDVQDIGVTTVIPPPTGTIILID